MIGRSSILDALRHEWEDVLATSRGRMLLVVGEPGLGKTRLAMEFQRHAELQAESVLQLNCHELFSRTPLYPVAGVLWSGAGLAADDNEATRTAKLRSFLESYGLSTTENIETTSGLLESFGLPRLGASNLVPSDIKNRQFRLLLSLLRETVNRGPIVLWLEDAHWLDPSSAELLEELASRVEQTPILFLVTTRPPVAEYLSFARSSTTIELAPLSAAECLELAYSVPGAKMLPADVLKQVVALADGSPLFVEHLTLSLIDSQGRAQAPGARTDALPLTLAEMMSERLDRLPDGRRIVQMAACLGRSFARPFLEGLLDQQPGQLTELLEQLVKAEILRLQEGTERYEFRHALLRHAAYDLMAPSARRAAHGRIAKALALPDGGPAVPEVLAHHLTEAGLFKEATGAWLQAANVAARRSANVEAIAHVERGLGIVGQIPDPETRRILEISLQASLIGPFTATVGATYEKLLVCCQRGLQLCKEGGPNPLIFAFLFGQFTHAICRGDTALATASADLFLSTATNAKYESGKVIGHRLTGMVRLGKGDILKSIESLKASLDLYVPERDEAATHVFGQNAQVHSRSLLSFALLHAGKIDEALQAGTDALASVDELKHPHSSALALGYVGGWVFGLCGFTDQLMQASRRLVTLAEQHDIGNMRRFGQAFIGWALCQSGDLTQGIAYLEQAVNELEAVGFRLTLPGHMSVLADAMRQAGRHEEAAELCRRALKIVEEGGEHLHEPEVRRVQAMLAADKRGRADAEVGEMFRAAVACAQLVQSPLLEYRALHAMADTMGIDALTAPSRQRLEDLGAFGQLSTRADRIFGFTYPVAAQ